MPSLNTFGGKNKCFKNCRGWEWLSKWEPMVKDIHRNQW